MMAGQPETSSCGDKTFWPIRVTRLLASTFLGSDVWHLRPSGARQRAREVEEHTLVLQLPVSHRLD